MTRVQPNPLPASLASRVLLECRGVSHNFGAKHVLHDINLHVLRGQIVAMVGPSGSGKSTLLRAILGTHPANNGRVLMDGRPVLHPCRDVGIVYQRYTLYPFLTAVENVAFGPLLDRSSLTDRAQFWRYRKVAAAHRDEAAAWLEKVGLGHCLSAYPSELSGGMCQRVAIAQALILRPKVLLLDEPFGALDEATREDLQTMLLELYQENLLAHRAGKEPPYTIIIVTHELSEALFVSDRVIGLSQYWRWEDAGHKSFPGATLIYDAVAPVFAPTDSREFELVREQRQEIRHAVMEPEPRRPREQFVRFWQELQANLGGGILKS
ncbi:MAG: ABC transporter ATP-binding protein [Phycisphaerales bacterium]